jgi:3-isopropylmalate dehydratase small subunit
MPPNENSEKLSSLIHVPTETEAAPIVEALKEAGISAIMTGSFTAGFLAEAPGDISIQIFKRDSAAANKVLKKFKADNASIDWDQVDVGEPEDESR